MKIMYSWRRNTPSTVTGESVTVTILYSSFKKDEIDELEQAMPKGTIIMESSRPVVCTQEAVKPVWKDNKIYCGACGKRIPRKIGAHYCHKCGRQIAWNMHGGDKA